MTSSGDANPGGGILPINRQGVGAAATLPWSC